MLFIATLRRHPRYLVYPLAPLTDVLSRLLSPLLLAHSRHSLAAFHAIPSLARLSCETSFVFFSFFSFRYLRVHLFRLTLASIILHFHALHANFLFRSLSSLFYCCIRYCSDIIRHGLFLHELRGEHRRRSLPRHEPRYCEVFRITTKGHCRRYNRRRDRESRDRDNRKFSSFAVRSPTRVSNARWRRRRRKPCGDCRRNGEHSTANVGSGPDSTSNGAASIAHPHVSSLTLDVS